jgi:hypothetical protein
MKKWEAKTLRTKSCSAKAGGGGDDDDDDDDDESLNKLNFSLHNCPLIFHKQQRARS